MEAIVNVSKFNQYSKFNGRTFEVKELLSTTICLDIDGVSTDFSHTEVILVNINKIYEEHAEYICRASQPDEYRFKNNLVDYINRNKLILK